MDYGMKPASVQKRKVASVARGNRKAIPAKKVAGMKSKVDALSKMQAKEVASRMGNISTMPVKRQPKPVSRGPKDVTTMPVKPRKKK